jgi:hypothetical protein
MRWNARLYPARRVRGSAPASARREGAVGVLGVVHLGQRPHERRLPGLGDRERQPDQVRVALAERDRTGGQRPAPPFGMQRDVRPVTEARKEEAVRRAPRAALVPAEEHEPGLRLLPGEAVEACGVAVGTHRDRPGGSDGQEAGDEHEEGETNPSRHCSHSTTVQLNVTSGSSRLRAPARHCRRASSSASCGQPVRPNTPSVTTARVLPSQR